MLVRFYLCNHGDGRIVLSDQLEGHSANPHQVLPELDAAGNVVRSAWQVARDDVDMYGLNYRPGYGWYRVGVFTRNTVRLIG